MIDESHAYSIFSYDREVYQNEYKEKRISTMQLGNCYNFKK